MLPMTPWERRRHTVLVNRDGHGAPPATASRRSAASPAAGQIELRSSSRLNMHAPWRLGHRHAATGTRASFNIGNAISSGRHRKIRYCSIERRGTCMTELWSTVKQTAHRRLLLDVVHGDTPRPTRGHRTRRASTQSRTYASLLAPRRAAAPYRNPETLYRSHVQQVQRRRGGAPRRTGFTCRTTYISGTCRHQAGPRAWLLPARRSTRPRKASARSTAPLNLRRDHR